MFWPPFYQGVILSRISVWTLGLKTDELTFKLQDSRVKERHVHTHIHIHTHISDKSV